MGSLCRSARGGRPENARISRTQPRGLHSHPILDGKQRVHFCDENESSTIGRFDLSPPVTSRLDQHCSRQNRHPQARECRSQSQTECPRSLEGVLSLATTLQ